MSRCHKLWSHLSVGHCPAWLQEQLGNCWAIVVLCTLGTSPSGFPSAAAWGLQDMSQGLDCWDFVSCSIRQVSSRPAMSCVRLSVFLPCIPGCPIQQLSDLPDPQAQESCRQQAAHEGIRVYCQDHLVHSFSFQGTFTTCTRALSLSSRAGHANTGISTVRHGEGQPDGNGFTVLVPLALWSQALQQVPHANQHTIGSVNNHRFLLLG